MTGPCRAIHRNSAALNAVVKRKQGPPRLGGPAETDELALLEQPLNLAGLHVDIDVPVCRIR